MLFLLNCSQTRILTPFSLPLMLEIPASKSYEVRGASSPVQLLHNRPTLPVMETSPLLVSVLTRSLVMSTGAFSAAPGSLSSGLGWDTKDRSKREQIHEELKHISPLSSKAMEENTTWQWDPRAQYFLSPLLWCKTSGKATPVSVSAWRVLLGLAHKCGFIWEGRTSVLFTTPHLDMGCSTIPQAAKPTTPPSYPPPEAASHVLRQMWRYVTSSALRSRSSMGTLL